MKVQYTKSEAPVNNFHPMNISDSIETDNLVLTFTGFDQDKSEIRFDAYDKASKATEKLTFGLKWWASFSAYGGGLTAAWDAGKNRPMWQRQIEQGQEDQVNDPSQDGVGYSW